MARRTRRRTRFRGARKSSLPDIGPLVNVALVLLIFFMVVVPFFQEGIFVETPFAQNATEIVEQLGEESLVLSIKADGSLYINLQQVTRGELKKELARAYQGREGEPIIIKDSENLPHQEVLELMQIGQEIGAPRVDLMPKKEQ
jgi:biopolymer transport protein TolR